MATSVLVKLFLYFVTFIYQISILFGLGFRQKPAISPVLNNGNTPIIIMCFLFSTKL